MFAIDYQAFVDFVKTKFTEWLKNKRAEELTPSAIEEFSQAIANAGFAIQAVNDTPLARNSDTDDLSRKVKVGDAINYDYKSVSDPEIYEISQQTVFDLDGSIVIFSLKAKEVFTQYNVYTGFGNIFSDDLKCIVSLIDNEEENLKLNLTIRYFDKYYNKEIELRPFWGDSSNLRDRTIDMSFLIPVSSLGGGENGDNTVLSIFAEGSKCKLTFTGTLTLERYK